MVFYAITLAVKFSPLQLTKSDEYNTFQILLIQDMFL